ncbi:MAG TPA: hypothetical protein VFS20_15390 [Longimicrobium sp.]|nr:hypothetical protein [Longimicrobium sp.]
MDPVTTSVIAALQKLSEPLVKDAYDGLKALIARKFGRDSRIAAAVDAAEAQPQSPARAAVVQEEVAAAAADQDPEIVEQARALGEVVSGTAAPSVSVHQQVSGSGNVFSGTGDVHVQRPG